MLPTLVPEILAPEMVVSVESVTVHVLEASSVSAAVPNRQTVSRRPGRCAQAGDEVAASTVAELASSLGFRPVRVGPLAAARELEAVAWLNIRLQMVTAGDWRSSFVLVGAPSRASRRNLRQVLAIHHSGASS
jgi:predicted dinucleotide-binding enzyme